MYVASCTFMREWQQVVSPCVSAAACVLQAAVRWPVKADGKKQGWAHVQFAAASDIDAAVALSGQALMGRDLEVQRATDKGEPKLNLGQSVPDCWFCLSNPEVRLPARRASFASTLLPCGLRRPTGSLSSHVPHDPKGT